MNEAGARTVNVVGSPSAAEEPHHSLFKRNAAHRHHIPRAQYRVRNWSTYDAGLRRRGDLPL